jgi:hypothetical protein
LALRELHKIPADTREFLTDYLLDEHKYHARQIADAAKFCDETAAELTRLEAVHAPLVVYRNHGHREARGYVRMLAVETRKLFGAKLYGTLANVASVALNKEAGREVTPKQAENWCKKPEPSGAKARTRTRKRPPSH